MKIIIAGAGLTGCTFAKILKNKGNNVEIIEKLPHAGGLCFTKRSPNGFLYEPYGSRVFHTKSQEIWQFVGKFAVFNGYKHNKGVIIKDKLYHFPISLQEIAKMPLKEKILRELRNRPELPDHSNFETSMISQFGNTLYNLFIYNYSKKMWAINPSELEAHISEGRVELKEKNGGTFEGEYQGVPVGGYTRFIEKIIEGIPIQLGKPWSRNHDRDLVIYSGRIDELLDFKYGILPYRSMDYKYEAGGCWECNIYGTINLPDHHVYIRKANYRVLYDVKSSDNWIQYQKAVEPNKMNAPMYPVPTKGNKELLRKYLLDACSIKNLMPAGRLGLYQYLNMDQAVGLAIKMEKLVYRWKNLSRDKRFEELLKLAI